MTSKTFISRCHFDANLYSDPLAIMNLIWEYENSSHKGKFGWNFSLATARVNRLVSTRNSIRSRVAHFIGGDASRFEVKESPSLMPHAKAVILRIVLVWVLHDNLIQSFQVPNVSDDSVNITLTKNLIKNEQLNQVLDETRHHYHLATNQETEQKGTFARSDSSEDFVSFLRPFEDRFISYCAENEYRVAWFRVDSSMLVLLIVEGVAKTPTVCEMKEEVLVGCGESFATATANVDSNYRGRNGRPCGLWKVHYLEHQESEPQNGNTCIRFVRFATNQKGLINKLAKTLKIKSLQMANVEKTLSCHFFVSNVGKRNGELNPGFSLFTRGQADQVSKIDVMDLFSTSVLEMFTRQSEKPTQEVRFNITPNLPLGLSDSGKKSACGGTVDSSSSWTRPLLNDIPEGARILSIIASNRRPDHYIDFSVPDGNDEKLVKVEMSRSESRIGERWTSFPNNKSVFVDVNCVPAASQSMDGPVEVFAVAGDSLELKGGKLRVSGLTLLPPGRLFLLLCMKSFGLHPVPSSFGNEDKELDQCLIWLQQSRGKVSLGSIQLDEMVDRIVSAIEFHESCGNLGEKLECYPELVVRLLSIFDQVDGYPCAAWDGLFVPTQEAMDTPRKVLVNTKNKTPVKNVGKASSAGANGVDLTSANQNGVAASSKKKKKKTKGNGPAETISTDTAKVLEPLLKAEQQPTPPQKNACEAVLLTQFSKKSRKQTSPLFSVKIDDSDCDLPSTNILSWLIASYSEAVNKTAKEASADKDGVVPQQWAIFVEIAQAASTKNNSLSLSPHQWRVFRVQGKNGKDWYSAAFVGSLIPLLPLEGRGAVKLWMKDGVSTPTKSNDALSCVPPNVAVCLTHWTAKVTVNESKEESMILFPDMETALRMAAVYWLERQFYEGGRHWYELELDDMKQRILASWLGDK